MNDIQQQVTEKAAAIARDIAAKHADDVDTRGRFPDESLAALAREGLLGLCVPASHGGMGQGPRAFAAVAEELGQACASTAMVYVMHVTAAQAITLSTTLAGRDELLRAIAAGRHLTTLAFSETGSRSNFWAPVSQLVPSGDGFTVTAHKSWVTAAHHADSYVTSAQRPGAASALESAAFLVRKEAPGVVLDGQFDGVGLRGNDSAPMRFQALQVAPGDLLGEQGAGAKVKLEIVLPWFSIGTAAMANGLGKAAIGITAAHLQGARLEHMSMQLRDLPQLRARIAEMSIRNEQARALLDRMLVEIEQARPTAPLFVLQSRAASLQAAVDVTDLMMKACGGAAFSKHLPAERLFRDARAGWVMAPTVDHLLDFIGKALTGLPLF